MYFGPENSVLDLGLVKVGKKQHGGVWGSPTLYFARTFMKTALLSN